MSAGCCRGYDDKVSWRRFDYNRVLYVPWWFHTGDFFSDQPMGVPKISYDFQAPLGEFGLEAPSFRLLRTIHSFLDDFGDRLAPMVTVMPDNASFMTPDNCNDLRYAARMNSRGEGFLFLVNSQDHDSI